MTIGNGLIAAFICGIAMSATEHKVPDGFVEFADNTSTILQVITFFVFGALIVGTGFDGNVAALVAFIAFALLVARPVAVMLSFVRTKLPRPQRLFVAWFGPKGVASMLFALFVLKSQVENGELIFDIAAITVIASIVAHGLTDTVGSRWIKRRTEGKRYSAPQVSREAWSAPICRPRRFPWILSSLPGWPVFSSSRPKALLFFAFAFAVMADPVSSVAYAIEAALRALGGHLNLLLPTMGIVIGIIALITANYWQLVRAFPKGGGSPEAAGRAFGEAGHSCRSAL